MGADIVILHPVVLIYRETRYFIPIEFSMEYDLCRGGNNRVRLIDSALL